METAASLHHHLLPAGFPHRPTGPRLPNKRPRTVGSASERNTYGGDHGGSLVDENIIVLRKRVHEMRMAERNYEPPAHWMEWEKQYYTSYDSDVCEAMGLLQTLLMNTRPSVAVGMIGLLMLSVPTSAILILLRLMEALGPILMGMHLT